MKKKIVSLMLASMMIAGAVTGCGSSNTEDSSNSNVSGVSENESAESSDMESSDGENSGMVTVSTAYGDVEVAYSPDRICVLDLSTMDIVGALGLGETVVSLQWAKHYPNYLEEYYNSETIISLTSSNGNKGSETTEDTETDPYEIYYGIDADVIIGTTERITEDLYAVLSQIAPTIALPTALESTDGIYAGMSENAKAIASIWGMDGEMKETFASYDDLYAQISEAVTDKTFVMTTGNTDLSTVQIGSASRGGSTTTETSTEKTESTEASSKESSSNFGSSKKKNNTANIVIFLTQLGMTDLTETVSKDASVENLTALSEAGSSAEEIGTMVLSAISAVEPDALFVYNYGYSSLEEIREEGLDIAGLEDLAFPTCFVSNELTYTTGGMTSVTSVLEQLAEVFLD